jgi:nucleoid-associated protein YgaU
MRLRAALIIFFCFATFGATVSPAQDVAEAARQERARKESQPKRAKHVYTEADLARPHILVAEDAERAEAKRNECLQQQNCPTLTPQTPQQIPSTSLNADSLAPTEVPLGDVARKYRKEKELQAQNKLQAQKQLQAFHPKQTTPFHLPYSTPALASPIAPERAEMIQPKANAPVTRRDPFRAVTIRPAVPERRTVTVYPPAVAERRAAVPEVLPANSEVARPARPVAPVHPVTQIHPVDRTQPVAPHLPIVSAQPIAPLHSVAPARPAPRPVALPGRTIVPAIVTSPNSVSVHPGDSLWKLAQQHLGRGNRWREFLEVNPWIADPNKIRAGSQIALPTPSASPHLPSKIKVGRGDTLWKLAKANLGRADYWPCLARANPQIRNAGLIYEDQELVLPAGCEP